MKTDQYSHARRMLVGAVRLCPIVCLILIANPATAIVDPDNLGQWTKPAETGPDKEVPGFLVNLGPTGARAILKENSFVVKHVFARSPAHDRLRIDDEITGANGKAFSKHTFGKFYGMAPAAGYEGPMMDLGNAIEESEGADGLLKLDIIRENKPLAITIPLAAIGRFSATYPANCPKSAKLAANATRYLIEKTDEQSDHVHEQAKVGLALLAAGKTKEAAALADKWITLPDEKLWTWYPAYRCIFLCEYYLETRDERVLPTIKELTRRLYLAQVLDPELYKDRMHGGKPQAANFLKGGLGHGHRIAGYGTMTITTLMAMLSWELAAQCGVEIDQNHVDIAYQCIHQNTHESGYMGYRFATGSYSPVGRQGLSILVHHLVPQRTPDGYVDRVTGNLVESRTRLNDGHGDNVQAVFWALLGIQMSGDEAAIRTMFDYNKAFINMARTHDGAFVVQPGRNAGEKAYYLSPRIQSTAAMAIILGAPGNPRLRIQGNPG